MTNTRLSAMSGACEQVHFQQKSFTLEPLARPTTMSFSRRKKEKVVFVVGPTGSGKSRLAIDLATRFPAEVVNCDKMQVYEGLDVATNKVTDDERRGVPHHLLGVVHDPLADFTSADFCRRASLATESILARGRLPIVAGGSNSFVEALVDGDVDFRSRHEFCFLWVDVALPVLCEFISDRVDRMVEAGLVDEVRAAFDPTDRDYSRGIRRTIGLPELDEYLRSSGDGSAALLEAAIERIKENTCRLASRQLKKIQRLNSRWNWSMHRVDATEVFLRRGSPGADEIWEELVAGPSTEIVDQFLRRELNLVSTTAVEGHTAAGIPLPAAMAAAGITL